MHPYKAYVLELISLFDQVTLEAIPRTSNRVVDAMATAASLLPLELDDEYATIIIRQLQEPTLSKSCLEPLDVFLINETTHEPLYINIFNFIQNETFPYGFDRNHHRLLCK